MLHVASLAFTRVFHALRAPASHPQIFRAHRGVLARTLWWDDDAEENNGGGGGSVAVSLGTAAFQSAARGADAEVGDMRIGGGGRELEEWEIRRDRSDSRHCLRQFVSEAMALADFFARDNPRGKVRVRLLNRRVNLSCMDCRVKSSDMCKR